MEQVSPLRADVSGGEPALFEGFSSPPPTLLHSEYASFTQFISLPPRYRDLDVPEWAYKHVFGDMNALRLQMDCKWLVEPHEVWRQVCLNGDLESMFSGSVVPRRKSHRSWTVTPESLDNSTTGDSSDPHQITIWR
jgi:hypothetical protein